MSAISTPVREHAREVPGNIRRAVEGLAGDRQFGIIVYLIKEDGQSFSELSNELDMHQQSLSDALNKLQDGGLIIRIDTQNTESNFDTRYEVTQYGKRLLDELFDAIQPRRNPDVAPLATPNNWGESAVEDNQYMISSPENRSSGATRILDGEESADNTRDYPAIVRTAHS